MDSKSDYYMADMKNFSTAEKDVIVYGFGISGRWACDNLPNVIGVVDTDSKKWGYEHGKFTVVSPESLMGSDLQNSVVVITSVDIFDVIPLLKRYNVSDYIALGKIIEYDEVGVNLTGESNDFLAYSLNTVKLCHEKYMDDGAFFIRSIDLIITEKCTLKCVDCANLMQFYESPRNISTESSIEDMRLLLSKCDSINEVRVIGGEPFLNKDIHSLIPKLVDLSNIKNIVIYTNGMVPLKDEVLNIYRHPKIVFSITDYGNLAKHTMTLVEKLKANGVAFRLHPPEYWTDSGKIHNYMRSEGEMKDLFAKCCGKNLYSVAEGKLYRCPFVANADRLGAIPDDESNYVRLSATTEELRRYSYQINYIPACNYCNGRSFDSEEIVPAVQTRQPVKYIRIFRESNS